MVKIPFAKHRPSGRIVEVSTVPSGRACDCVCPSCGQIVLARKGEANQWCFAHDGNAGERPDEECDISFHVCCRQFIIEAALNGDLRGFVTPEHFFCLKVSDGEQVRVQVAKGNQYEELCWERGLNNFDLAAKIKNRYIHLYLAYPNRESPQLPDSPSRDGFLKVDIQPIKHAIDMDNRQGQNVLAQARDLFLTCDFKSWLYHPRVEDPDFQKKCERLKAEHERPVNEENPPRSGDALSGLEGRQQGAGKAKPNDSPERRKVARVKRESGASEGMNYAEWPAPSTSELSAPHDQLSWNESLVAIYYLKVYKHYLEAGKSQKAAVALLIEKESDLNKRNRLFWMAEKKRK